MIPYNKDTFCLMCWRDDYELHMIYLYFDSRVCA